MALNREQKQKIIDALGKKMEHQGTMVFVGFRGMKTKDVLALKKKLKAVNAVFKVCKKTLLNIVLRGKKMLFNARDLEGEVAVAFGAQDEASLAKTIYDFSKEQENLKILGGVFDNKSFKDREYVVAIAKLPSRQQLLTNFVGTIKAPLSNFIYVLQANIKGLVVALNAIKDKK